MLPYMSTPLIICGMPRSGTRMISNTLNIHPEVCIQSEIHQAVVFEFLAFVRFSTAFYAEMQSPDKSKKRTLISRIEKKFLKSGPFKGWYYARSQPPAISEKWQNKRRALIQSLWMYAGRDKEVVPQGDVVRYMGYKTPNHEIFFEDYEELLADKPPYYIFCTRNIGDCWRSVKNLGWYSSNNISAFKERYIKAHKQLSIMLQKTPERIIVFDLDTYKKKEDKLSYFDQLIFQRLSLAPTQEIENKIQSNKKVNASTSKGISQEPDNKTRQEMEELIQDKDVRKIHQECFG